MDDKPQTSSPRARLQELQAIPERQRTEAEWDELNELEIMLAAGNRQAAPAQGMRRDGAPPAGRPNPNAPPHGQKQSRKFHKRPPKRKGP